ncbi:hypothetical protein Zmor_018672 [Zophobas morio]|uniref:Uncharacterized protein n=1 Tax=Zophobas morio TaxID=2755281 RepID=A0AA38ME89_9CUCU|nr:hypothetical protein Zmor_018672 [Zophobas morio]
MLPLSRWQSDKANVCMCETISIYVTSESRRDAERATGGGYQQATVLFRRPTRRRRRRFRSPEKTAYFRVSRGSSPGKINEQTRLNKLANKGEEGKHG